ncbi:MAG: DUF4157 domain-containing protein, partial [Ilumatobacteraceae bacterium]
MSDCGSDYERSPDPTPTTRREWAALGPIGTTVAAVYTGQNVADFTAGLTTRRSIGLTHQPPAHRLAEDAPHGSLKGSAVKASEVAPGVAVDELLAPLGEPSALPPMIHRRLAPIALNRVSAQPHDVQTTADLVAPPSDSRSDEVPPEPTTSAAPPSMASAGVARRNLADSRRLGLGPSYHGSLPEAMRAERERSAAPPPSKSASEEREFTQPVPQDVIAIVERALPVHLGQRVVHRGRAATEAARGFGATAFTRDGEMYLSDDVGPLNTAQGRATVAHELTHVAQQMIGTTVDEGSPRGMAHEAAARQVEQHVRGDADALSAVSSEDPSQIASEVRTGIAQARATMRELIDSGLAQPDGGGGITFVRDPSSMTGGTRVQRQTAAAPPAAASRPGEAAREQNWNGLAGLSHGLGQGLANDLLSGATSMFGLSDSVVTGQRDELAAEDRSFRRDQTRDAFRELRLDHLQGQRLQAQNHDLAAQSQPANDQLTDDERNRLHAEVDNAVNERMRRLDEQVRAAVERANSAHPGSGDAADLRNSVGYDRAFHLLFDDPDQAELPATDVLTSAIGGDAGGGCGTHPAASHPG